jgi:hypothetical protein
MEGKAGDLAVAGRSGRRIRRGVDGWRALIEEHKVGGQTVAEFCAQRGIPRSSFIKWRGTLSAVAAPKAKRAAPGFLSVPIRAAALPATVGEPVELHVGAVRVRLSGTAANRVVEAIVSHIGAAA